MITFSFHGTSHGEGYFGVIKGIPKGTVISVDYINENLNIRKTGVGRSSRQLLQDKVVFSGHEEDRQFCADGSDLEFFVANASVETRPNITAIRSGHTDLVGPCRYPNMTARQVAEISSARNSLCYVVLGCICNAILKDWDIYTGYHVQQIGNVIAKSIAPKWHSLYHLHDIDCQFPCMDSDARQKMLEQIAIAKQNGESLGGVVCVTARAPMGIGEVFPYSQRLDAQISAQLMGIPSVKGISFGIGEEYACLTGSQAQDLLHKGVDTLIAYKTNKCGGIVGGITTGQDIVVNLTVKPIPTVQGVQTLDSQTLEQVAQHYERADTCVVPTVGLIAKHILSYVLANQVLKQYQQDATQLPKKHNH